MLQEGATAAGRRVIPAVNKWQVLVSVLTLGLFLGFLIPGFAPIESSHGIRHSELRRRAQRRHLYKQIGLSLIPLVLGGVGILLLRSRKR